MTLHIYFEEDKVKLHKRRQLLKFSVYTSSVVDQHSTRWQVEEKLNFTPQILLWKPKVQPIEVSLWSTRYSKKHFGILNEPGN